MSQGDELAQPASPEPPLLSATTPDHPVGAASGPVPVRDRGLWLAAWGLIVLGAGPLLAAQVVARQQRQLTVPGLRIAGLHDHSVAKQPASYKPDRKSSPSRSPDAESGLGLLPFSELPARVQKVGAQLLNQRVAVQIVGEKTHASWSELGVTLDEAEAVRQLQLIGHSGNAAADLVTYLQGKQSGIAVPLPVQLDEKRAIEFLLSLKDQMDRAPIDARLDLEKHTIAPEQQGILIGVYEAMVALQYAVRSLREGTPPTQIDLSAATRTAQPQVRREDLKGIDVSTVLGTWETRYSSASVDSDRTYNLKVGASKLNGYMLKPHQLFSFNAVVGDRTEKEGYRVAPVISGGELIDGLAGGMCQIASTLHAAAFFAGLEIVRSTPHSRPSTYIPMGLDSTVVYPSVDLKLKNPYDFPIVLHYVVNQGSVKVELLGKAQPYRVAFEREILSETPFPTTTRQDPEMPAGQKFIDQDGYPGYRIKRRRYIFTGKWKLDPKNENRPKPDVLIGKKEWDISYPATAQILRVGSGPPNLKKKDPPPSHRIPPLPAWAKPIFYIVK
ncbi:MAG: VanW family protein [Myxococcales bacterium]|nr:VanW family protein [Myxococcales bacterium]